MKPPILLTASALALTTAACGPKTPPVRAALDCPARQGELQRTSIASDGKTCTYVAGDGAEVTLALVSVRGGLDATLDSLESRLLPASDETSGPATPPRPAEVAMASEASRRAAAEAQQDAGAAWESKGGEAEVRTDPVSGVEDGHGTARVNLPGIHIAANDDEDTADVQIGPLRVNAGRDGATVRIKRDVRLRGEPLNPDQRGVRATFIYTGPDLPDGYRYVGYEAGGPKAGPITVALVRSKSDGPERGELYPDVKTLVRRNGGV
jgi:hypothetical protein